MRVQSENGRTVPYVPWPTEFHEAVARLRVSAAAFQVLMVIVRHTLGYSDGNGGRKEETRLTWQDIAEVTGLKRSTVYLAIKDLRQIGIITQDGGRIRLVSNPESWTDRPESWTDRPESGTERPESWTDRPESGTDRPESWTDRPESWTDDYLYRKKEERKPTTTTTERGVVVGLPSADEEPDPKVVANAAVLWIRENESWWDSYLKRFRPHMDRPQARAVFEELVAWVFRNPERYLDCLEHPNRWRNVIGAWLDKKGKAGFG